MNIARHRWNRKGASGLGRILNIIAAALIILLLFGIMYGYYALFPPHKAVLAQYASVAQDGLLLADMLRFPVSNDLTIGDLIARGELKTAEPAVKDYLEGTLEDRGYRLRLDSSKSPITIAAREPKIFATHTDPWADSIVSVGILPTKNGPPRIIVLEVLQ